MVSYRVLLCVVLVFALVPSVHAAATIADIYTAASEAEVLYGGGGDCADADPACSDADMPSVTDAYTVLGDGATSSYINVQDKGSTQTRILRITYDVNDVLSGTYTLRFAMKAPNTFNYYVCAYVNETHVNESSCLYFNYTDADTWHEADIDSVVRESIARFNQRVILRFVVEDTASQNSMDFSEMYLKRPFKPADFSIIPGGVAEAEIDTWVENTWAIVSVSEVPDITNASCELHRLNEGNETAHTEVNLSLLDPHYSVGADNSYFGVYWNANSSVEFMEEGYNYELECEGWLGEVHMQGFSQFVYINRERSLWENIADILSYLLQLIGIGEDTQQLVSAQADMVDAMIPLGGEGVATTFVTYADDTVDVNASCFIDVWYPNSTQWLDEQVMVQVGVDGRYTYAVSEPGELGLYQMRSFCNGSGLMNRTRYAYANLEVYQDVYMQMVSN